MAAELPNLSDRQIRVYAGSTRDTGAHRAPDPDARPSSPAAPRASANSPASLGQATVIPLRKVVQAGRATHRHLRGRAGARLRRPGEAGRSQELHAGIRRLRRDARRARGTSGSTPPRSIRARTSSPTRLSPPTSSSFSTSGRGSNSAVTNVQRIDSRAGPRLGRGRHRPRPRLVRHAQRSSPPRLEAGPGGLARRVEPPSHERADRGAPRRSPPRPASRSRRSASAPPSRRRWRSQPPRARCSRSQSSR